MITCVNTESAEFGALAERSGLNPFVLEVQCAKFLDEHDRWPKLDELRGANSEPYMREFLGLDSKYDTVLASELLRKTNTQSLPEAMVYLNQTFRDLKISYSLIGDKVKIYTDGRPNPFELKITSSTDFKDLSSSIFIGKALESLAEQMGIQTNYYSSEELAKMGILDQIPEAGREAAFIYEGNIYVNTDNASVDAPVHELMHVVMGALKVTNPDLYMNLVQQVQQLENYEDLAREFPNRAQSDINEELFVREYTRMLVGMESLFSQVDPKILYEINYELSRSLDTILDGDNSVRVIPEALRFGESLRNLGGIVNSHSMQNKFTEIFDAAQAHRILANVKRHLMETGDLEERCE